MQLILDTERTMTSRQIAEAVQSEHHNVLATIRRLRAEGVIAGHETPYTHEQNGQTYTEFNLSYRDTMVVASGYSAELRARIIDLWLALDSKPSVDVAFKVPQTFADALRLAADQQETIQQQAAQIAIAAPKAEFVDRYVDSTGSKGFRQVCKLLKAKEPEFRAFLHDKQIMYKLGGEWMPFAAHIDAGRFEVKAGTAQNEHAFNSARFTPKGITWVAGEFAKYQLEAV